MTSTHLLQQCIESHIKALEFSSPAPSLFQPISYTLASGGKRIRPLLTLISCELFSGDIHKAIPTALAIEVFHNFTLLHDDLMDKADLRRGRPTVHTKWSANTAILSGDAMLIEAYRLLAQSQSKQLPSLLSRFNQTAIEVCCGQQLDMEFEERENVSNDEYLQMIKLKTATLLGFALEAGATIAEASDDNIKQIYEFGINIGIAFQLKDDFLDVYGNSQSFGKKIGGDIICNKKTFLLTKALENKHTNKDILQWIRCKNFDHEEKITAVTQIYNSIGLEETTQNAIDQYYNLAINHLQAIKAPEENKQALWEITQQLRNRKA